MSKSGESKLSTYLAIGALTIGGLVAFLVMKSRKRQRQNRRLYSTSEHVHLSKGGNSASQNLNLGAGPANDQEDSAWELDYNRSVEPRSKDSTKTDLLHKGHVKGGKLLIVMVGLPGSGKTLIARKVARYLRWISYSTRAFSVAKYRLDKLGSKSADFFNPNHEGNYKQRLQCLSEALEDSIRYLHRGGEIAILDGSNSTRDRRDMIRERLSKENGYHIFWIESTTTSYLEGDDEARGNALKRSPDFLNSVDYQKRIDYYSQHYEPLDSTEGSYIKIHDTYDQFTLNRIQGYLPTRIVSFVVNLKPTSRPVYMCRHGESTYNERGLIGGDGSLSGRGRKFAQGLEQFIELGGIEGELDSIWVSTMKRSKETAEYINDGLYKSLVQWRALRDIEVGICDGMSYENIKNRFPVEFRSRNEDKLRYRYPRGESYLDVLSRLEPVIFELERGTKPILIIAHQAVLRCLYAYFLDLDSDQIPYVEVPLHTVFRVESIVYGCKERRTKINIDLEA